MKGWSLFFILFLNLVWSTSLDAQDVPIDTTVTRVDSFYQLKYKGLLGKLAQAIVVSDTNDIPSLELQRNDRKFQYHRNKVIRNIIIQIVPFGTPLSDTSKKFTNKLTNLADFFHYNTRRKIIRNNLFFRENEKLQPYLMADNERHLRDLVYLGDASIRIRRVANAPDSVDVLVLTKDVLSLGGRFSMSGIDRYQVAAREDNFMGMGDRLEFRMLFDQERNKKFGYGLQYIRRNIGGSFVDATIGGQTFNPTILGGWLQENTIYTQVVRPLVNPYMRHTYGFDAAYHTNTNMYMSDSLFLSDQRYSYYNIDMWTGITFDPYKNASEKDARLRTFLGLRMFHQKFLKVPSKFENNYFFRYADADGVLASLSMFSQNFFKTRYVYGLGRAEDVPEGVDVSVTTGWVNKQQRSRPYLGMGVQFSYFSKHDNYYSYTVRAGGFRKNGELEDVDLLANLQFFSNLKKMGRWKQRTFINAGVTRQLNTLLNEPLFIDSDYGLREFRNDTLFGGDLRATVKAESVFYNDWSLIGFKFAPFVFANAVYMKGPMPKLLDKYFFPSVGGGVRVRNESLVFGTVEFRGFYYPNNNFYNEKIRFEINTNLRFKYNEYRVRRPELITVN